MQLSVVGRCALLLVASTVFMTFAWYAHLKNLAAAPWWANRVGYAQLSLPQLKIMQEAITLTVFVPFAVLYMKQPIKLDYLRASLCIVGAVDFVFRG